MTDVNDISITLQLHKRMRFWAREMPRVQIDVHIEERGKTGRSCRRRNVEEPMLNRSASSPICSKHNPGFKVRSVPILHGDECRSGEGTYPAGRKEKWSVACWKCIAYFVIFTCESTNRSWRRPVMLPKMLKPVPAPASCVTNVLVLHLAARPSDICSVGALLYFIPSPLTVRNETSSSDRAKSLVSRSMFDV